VRDSNARLTD